MKYSLSVDAPESEACATPEPENSLSYENESSVSEIDSLASKVVAQWDLEAAGRLQKSRWSAGAAMVVVGIALLSAGDLLVFSEQRKGGGELVADASVMVTQVSERSLHALDVQVQQSESQMQMPVLPDGALSVSRVDAGRAGSFPPTTVNIASLMKRSVHVPNPAGRELGSTRAALVDRRPCTSSVSFCVNEGGGTFNVEVVGRCYDSKVDRVSLDTVRKWRFKPYAGRVCSTVSFSFEFDE